MEIDDAWDDEDGDRAQSCRVQNAESERQDGLSLTGATQTLCPACEGRSNGSLVAMPVAALKALQAKVAELEKVAQAYEDQVAAHNKTLDELKYTGLAAAAEAKRGDELQSQLAAQAALIEKCEKALQIAFKWGSPMLAAPRSTRPEWFGLANAAISAIAAQKGGAK